MIVGSGLIANVFRAPFERRDDVCIFAAGVSNSSCTNRQEFERDRDRLIASLKAAANTTVFVYFGTCSVEDPGANKTLYVEHKLAMERLVGQHPNSLILRLPQLAGRTPNPHTLLNFLYARIARGESFGVWRNAYRNIIDVSDVLAISNIIIENTSLRQCTLNLANPNSYAMLDIIRALELVTGKPAVYDILDCGHHYSIDVTKMLPALAKTDIVFDKEYLNRVLGKYYEKY